MVSRRPVPRRTWICGVLLGLSGLCFVAAFWLSVASKNNALAFAGCGLLLALWAPVVTSPSGVSPRDVVALVTSIRKGRRP